RKACRARQAFRSHPFANERMGTRIRRNLVRRGRSVGVSSRGLCPWNIGGLALVERFVLIVSVGLRLLRVSGSRIRRRRHGVGIGRTGIIHALIVYAASGGFALLRIGIELALSRGLRIVVGLALGHARVIRRAGAHLGVGARGRRIRTGGGLAG